MQSKELFESKEGVPHSVMLRKETLHTTLIANGATLNDVTKIPKLYVEELHSDFISSVTIMSAESHVNSGLPRQLRQTALLCTQR